MDKKEYFERAVRLFHEYNGVHWEQLVEGLLGLGDRYREAHPVTRSGMALDDHAGYLKDGLEKQCKP